MLYHIYLSCIVNPYVVIKQTKSVSLWNGLTHHFELIKKLLVLSLFEYITDYDLLLFFKI